MFKVLTLNNIAAEGLRRLPGERYELGPEISAPDAVILRSYNMHDMVIPESVAAIGRAGAGTNNIPVEATLRSPVERHPHKPATSRTPNQQKLRTNGLP